MYSYEDRIRAVKLYIKLGKRTGAIGLPDEELFEELARRV
jgi:hypothetical protein